MKPKLAKHRSSAFAATLAAIALAFSIGTANAAVPASPLPPLMRQAISDLEADLALSPPQRTQFSRAVARTEAVAQQIRGEREKLLAATRAELEKEMPDLAALADQRDNAMLSRLALRQSARTEWLQLYGMLDPGQVAVVRQRLQTVLAKVEVLREWLSPAARVSRR